jgi:hypothetical protein
MKNKENDAILICTEHDGTKTELLKFCVGGIAHNYHKQFVLNLHSIL